MTCAKPCIQPAVDQTEQNLHSNIQQWNIQVIYSQQETPIYNGFLCNHMAACIGINKIDEQLEYHFGITLSLRVII